jgi:peptidoglycan/LPS O-acetylase OafA/YrhL
VIEQRRVHYIDWLRVLAVLLLFPFHVSRVFNAGDPFYVKSPYVSSALGAVLSFISVWHMPLLFLLAGASSYFALRKRTVGKYAIERVKRLLLPFIFGFLVLIPPQTWIGGRFNSGYAGSFLHYLTSTDFLVFNIRDGGDYYGGFGIGHLWFVLWLFMISMVALPLLAWGRGERGQAALARFARVLAHPLGWLVAAFILAVGEALPDPVRINPFYYMAFFVLGYAIMFDGSVIETAERIRWPALITGFAVAAWFALTWRWRDSLPDPSAERAAITIVANLGCWLVLLGMLGLGKRHLDKPGPALAYLAPASYPLYIIHQTVIVLAAYVIVDLAIPGSVQWLLLFVVAVTGTFAVYEAVRRVPWLRKGFGLR